MKTYRFWATLLDSYNYFIESESENALNDLLATINKKTEYSEAAMKGVLFNEVVDIYKQLPDIKTLTKESGCFGDTITYKGIEFKTEIVLEFARYFEGSTRQLYTEAILPTAIGNVFLFGFVDEVIMYKAYDIKTTGQYEFPTFNTKYQHLVYPYCLRKQGHGISIFEYTITDFKYIYKEEYIYNDERDELRLKAICMKLIDFIERPEIKEQITNLKIYGNENSGN